MCPSLPGIGRGAGGRVAQKGTAKEAVGRERAVAVQRRQGRRDPRPPRGGRTRETHAGEGAGGRAASQGGSEPVLSHILSQPLPTLAFSSCLLIITPPPLDHTSMTHTRYFIYFPLYLTTTPRPCAGRDRGAGAGAQGAGAGQDRAPGTPHHFPCSHLQPPSPPLARSPCLPPLRRPCRSA